MTVKIKFPVVLEKGIRLWLAAAFIGLICVGYIALSAYALFSSDEKMFQSSGAIGVAAIISLFGLKSAFDRRKSAWLSVAIAMSVSDLMVTVRNKSPLPNEVTSEQAGATVQTAADKLAAFNKSSDFWLIVETIFLVLFTVQWGFGDILFLGIGGAQ